MASGLHPYSPRLGMLLQRLRLEHGLIVGLGVFIAGLAGSTYAVVSWAGKSFGDLDPFESMRVVIPSALALVLVLQIIWSSLHLGLMQAALTKRQSEIARDR